jgi:hypothetical protein
LASNSFCLFIEQIICHFQIPQKQAKNPSNPHKIGLKAIFSLNEVEASDTICVKSDKNCQNSMIKPLTGPPVRSPTPALPARGEGEGNTSPSLHGGNKTPPRPSPDK